MPRYRRLSALLIAAITLTLPATATSGDKTNPGSNDPRAALSKIATEKKQAASELATARTRHGELQKRLRDVELQTNRTVASLRLTRNRIEKMAARLKDLQSHSGEQEYALDHHKAQIADQLTRGYALHRMQRIAAAVNSGDASTLSRQRYYLDSVTTKLTSQADALALRTTELQQTRDEITTQQRELEALRTDQTAQLNALNEQTAEQQKIASSLAALIQTKASQLNSLSEDEKRLKTVLQRLSRADKAKQKKATATAPQLPTLLDGKVVLPVNGPILRSFGSLGATGRSQPGILIGAASGDEVHAVGEGEVVFADWMRGYGMLMIIDHGGDLLSLYGQNESLLKGVGDRVRKGDVIASAGQSGGQSRPGVYFEIRQRGKPVDPMTILRR